MRGFGRIGWVLAVVAAGCASNELRPLPEEDVVRRLEARGLEAMDLKVALAPIQITYEASRPGDDPGEGAWSVEMRRRGMGGLRSEFEDVLRRRDLFREVIPLDGGGDPFQAAWDAGADLLVQIDIRRYQVAYAGTTGWFVPNILLWAYFWVPSWWVADERFRSEMEVGVQIRSVHTGEVVWRRTYEKTVERALDDWERGWILFGIFRAPGAFEEENWEKVNEVVTPFAIREVVLQLYGDLQGDFRAYKDGPEFRDRMTKTLALVVGITKYQYRRIRNIGYADRDAQDLRDLLVDPGVGRMIPQNVKVLVDEDATREGIHRAIDEFLARRAYTLDNVILFFAGNATARGEGRYLLPWDFNPDNVAETAMEVGDLAGSLEAVTCRNLVTLLDCSFRGESDGRCFPLPDRPTEAIGDDFIRPLADEEGRWVLLGAQPDQSANEQDNIQNGIFSYLLMEALRGKADGDGDGAVSLSEVFAYVKDRVATQSQLATGRDQVPRLIPEASGDPAAFSIISPP